MVFLCSSRWKKNSKNISVYIGIESSDIEMCFSSFTSLDFKWNNDDDDDDDEKMNISDSPNWKKNPTSFLWKLFEFHSFGLLDFFFINCYSCL